MDWIVCQPMDSVLACGWCVRGTLSVTEEKDRDRPILGVRMAASHSVM